MKLKMHDYQKYAVEFIMNNRSAGIFLECGLGKSVITLTALQLLLHDYFEISKVLVVAPLRVADTTWNDEIEKWDHLNYLRISKILGSKKKRKEALDKKSDIYTINRENIPWLVEIYKDQWPFDMVVIDELSSFKSPSAKRFKSLKKVRYKIKRIVGLTGTPAPNGLLNIWSQIYLLDSGERLGRTYTGFRNRYFHPSKYINGGIPADYEINEDAEGNIYEKLRDICISMKAHDHLNMPECVYNKIEVEMSEKEMKLYRQLEKDLLLPFDDSDVDASNAAVLSNKLLQLSGGAVYDEENKVREIHEKKLEALEDLIESANGKPILVYYAFKHEKIRIKRRFNVHEISSSDDIRKWNEGKIKIALCHPASTGHGLNLQKGGSTLVWFGLTWSLELYIQANERLWRQGQKNTVVIHHLITKDTIDEKVLLSLENKTVGQATLIDAVKARLKIIKEENREWRNVLEIEKENV